MTEKFILVVGNRYPFEKLARELALAGLRSFGLTTVDDLSQLHDAMNLAAVVCVHDGGDDFAGVSQALWHLSRFRRPVPVMVCAERYQPEEALTFFRMGVIDYLAFDEHAGRIASIIKAVIWSEPLDVADPVGVKAHSDLSEALRSLVAF